MHCLYLLIYERYFFKQLIKFLWLLLLALNVFSAGNESDSLLLETLDDVLIEEYKPCSDDVRY